MYPQSMPVLSKNKKNIKNDEILEFFTTTRAFSLYKTGSGFRYRIFSQLAEKIPN